MASPWVPRAMNATLWPAAAIRPPKYPPTAPAAITAIRISQRSSCTGKGARCAAADALDLCFLLYRRLDCVDYAFCELIVQVEYAG
jgi:hypothetical protein